MSGLREQDGQRTDGRRGGRAPGRGGVGAERVADPAWAKGGGVRGKGGRCEVPARETSQRGGVCRETGGVRGARRRMWRVPGGTPIREASPPWRVCRTWAAVRAFRQAHPQTATPGAVPGGAGGERGTLKGTQGPGPGRAQRWRRAGAAAEEEEAEAGVTEDAPRGGKAVPAGKGATAGQTGPQCCRKRRHRLRKAWPRVGRHRWGRHSPDDAGSGERALGVGRARTARRDRTPSPHPHPHPPAHQQGLGCRGRGQRRVAQPKAGSGGSGLDPGARGA